MVNRVNNSQKDILNIKEAKGILTNTKGIITNSGTGNYKIAKNNPEKAEAFNKQLVHLWPGIR